MVRAPICVCHAPPPGCARYVEAAAAKLAPEGCTCLVSLPGLSAWVRAGERWNDAELIAACGEEAADAAKAMALNKPRPGHSAGGGKRGGWKGQGTSPSQAPISCTKSV